MSGPVPQEVKRRRNKPKIAPTSVAPGAYSGISPALPNADSYSQRTRDWYETYRTCEQAELFTKTAWQTLWDLAPLMDLYYTAPTPTAWAQIKQTLSGFLALPADQRRANWKVEPPKKGTSSKPSGTNVIEMSDRRNRLLADGA